MQIPPELAEELIKVRPVEAFDDTPVFDCVPSIDIYKSDLKAAKIPYKDESGRQADFHALRMTYGTILAKSGVNVRTAMELMRHTDIRLTTKVYTDPTLLNTASAVQSLPRLGKGKDAIKQKATGTDGKVFLSSGLSSQRTLNETGSPRLSPVMGVEQEGDGSRKSLKNGTLSNDCHHKNIGCHRTGDNDSKNWGTRIRT